MLIDYQKRIELLSKLFHEGIGMLYCGIYFVARTTIWKKPKQVIQVQIENCLVCINIWYYIYFKRNKIIEMHYFNQTTIEYVLNKIISVTFEIRKVKLWVRIKSRFPLSCKSTPVYLIKLVIKTRLNLTIRYFGI